MRRLTVPPDACTHTRQASLRETSATLREPVTEGIREILVTLVEAIGLVMLVVFVFLQSWRATLIPLLTVPVSLVGAFAVFPLLGFFPVIAQTFDITEFPFLAPRADSEYNTCCSEFK